MRFTTSSTLLLASSLLAACGVPQDEAPSSPVSDESLARNAQAVDDSCVDSGVTLAQPDGAVVAFSLPHCSYANFSATSVDGTYDQPLCPHHFVTEVQNINGNAVQPFVEAIPAGTMTESACKGVAILGSAWGYRNGAWVALGSVNTTGIWHPAVTGPIFSFPAYCQLSFNIGSSVSGYTKVRVTGLAAALGIFPGRVSTGVSGGNGPC